MDLQTKWRFLQLYCMVVADGVIDARELETLYRIGRDNYGLSANEISQAVTEAGATFPLPTDLKSQVNLLYEMAIIAWADGIIEDSEKHLLKSYALKMGFKEENLDEIVDFLLLRAKYNTPFDKVLNEITSD